MGLLSEERKLIHMAKKEYDPESEQAYLTAIKQDNTKLSNKYKGSNLGVPLPFTPETDSKIANNIFNMQDANALPAYKNEILKREGGLLNKELYRLHTHPTKYGKENLMNAYKPPSAPDMVNVAASYTSKLNKKAKVNSNLVYTKEFDKDVAYRFDIPKEDKKYLQTLDLEKDIFKDMKLLPFNQKYTNMELKATGQGLLDTAGHVLTNPGDITRHGDIYWSKRGQRLMDEYKANKMPIERIEL